MECINIDYVGPYTDGGYALVFIDMFTRWIEIHAVDNASAVLKNPLSAFYPTLAVMVLLANFNPIVALILLISFYENS